MDAVEDGSAPDPRDVVDPVGFIDALNRLRDLSGSPPYRTLARRVGPLLRPPREVSYRTVASAFSPGRRRLDPDLVLAIVRALGASEPRVEDWRRALARVTASARTGGPIGVFRQLPTDLPTFIGREQDLQLLLDTVGPDGAGAAPTVVIASVEGMAGVGKTQFAVHAAHRLVRSGRFADLQLYVNLRGFDPEQPPADPGTVLEAFLRQLEVPARLVPPSVEERSAMFRDRLHGRDALILLDNAADERQVRDLIPGHPGCLVLVTSRRTLAGLDGAAAHRLGVFTTDEAVRLLSRIAGAERVAAEPDSAERLVNLAGHLPLAVAIAAAYARGRPDWTLADVAHRLDGGDLAGLAVGDRRLSAVFELSYKNLSTARRRMFRRLSLHPGADFTVGSAAALCGLPAEQARSALDALVDEHLVQARAGRRFEFHDLLRTFARAKTQVEDTPEEQAEAVGGALAWLQYATASAAATMFPTRVRSPDVPPDPLWELPRFVGYDDAHAWLSVEQAGLTAAVYQAADIGADEWAWKIAFKMHDFQMLAAHPRDLLDLLRTGLKCAVRSGDEHGQSALHNVLAIAEAEHGSLHRAAEHFQACCEIRNRRGEQGAEAVALGNLGLLYRLMGRLEEAEATLSRALRICHDFGGETDRRAGSILDGLGQVRRDQDRYDEAEQYFTRAIDLYRNLGDQHGLARSTNELATCSALRGDLDAARKLREKALAVARRVGDARSAATILEGLASDADTAGDGDRAREYRREAAEIREG